MDRATLLNMVGQQVSFGRAHGQKTLGTVIQVNQTTCKIRQDEVRGVMKTHNTGKMWKVPFSMIYPVAVANSSVLASHSVQHTAPVVPPPSIHWIEQNQEILLVLSRLYNQLSPENLHADGERPIAQVRALAASLNKKLEACFVLLERRVDESECFNLMLRLEHTITRS